MRRDLRRYLAFESRTGKPGPLEALTIVLESHGLQGVLVYRLGSWINRAVRPRALKLPLKLLYLALHEAMMIAYGIEIQSEAQIGGGLLIPHPNGVIIGAVVMGEDCVVGQNATIGVRPGLNKKKPSIGSRVFVGPGSVVFGSIVIGDGATIGPLTVVSRNVRPRSMVIGNPLQILQKEHDNSEMIYLDRPLEPSSAPTPKNGASPHPAR